MQLQNILFYSAILPNILLFWCRIFVFGLTWKILFRSNPTTLAADDATCFKLDRWAIKTNDHLSNTPEVSMLRALG